MKLAIRALALAAGTLLAATVAGQAPPQRPPAGASELAQFGFGGGQTGVSPQPGTFGLLPGQEGRLALYCVDLFHDTPSDRHIFTGSADPRAVVVAGGEQMTIQEAIAAGYLSVRGRDPRTDPPRDARQWIDLYLTNHTRVPVTLRYPAGYAFVPRGRTAPTLAPGLVRMLETAYQARLTGTDTLAYAMWASRGFTREDVAQTQLRPVPDAEAAKVQKLLDAAGIEQRFDREQGCYGKLYAEREKRLGEEGLPLEGTATLAWGTRVNVTGKRSPSGEAVIAVQPARARAPLYYEARVRTLRGGKAELELLHLKTGRPLQVNNGRLTVRLTPA